MQGKSRVPACGWCELLLNEEIDPNYPLIVKNQYKKPIFDEI
jgi:hypothetical protein